MGPSMMGAPMPPQEAMPAPPMGPEGMPPEAMGGMPPEMGGMPPAGPQFPSLDEGLITQMLMQVAQLQAADHENLAAQQQEVLAANPVFQAMMSGAMQGPGAGAAGVGEGAAPTAPFEDEAGY